MNNYYIGELCMKYGTPIYNSIDYSMNRYIEILCDKYGTYIYHRLGGNNE